MCEVEELLNGQYFEYLSTEQALSSPETENSSYISDGYFIIYSLSIISLI
jgi:hypothetical protein